MDIGKELVLAMFVGGFYGSAAVIYSSLQNKPKPVRIVVAVVGGFMVVGGVGRLILFLFR